MKFKGSSLMIDDYTKAVMKTLKNFFPVCYPDQTVLSRGPATWEHFQLYRGIIVLGMATRRVSEFVQIQMEED